MATAIDFKASPTQTVAQKIWSLKPPVDTFDEMSYSSREVPKPQAAAGDQQQKVQALDGLNQQLDSIPPDTPIICGLVLLTHTHDERLQGGV